MCIFKRKKKTEETANQPVILHMPEIEPTTCKCCRAVYQANATHFRLDPTAIIVSRQYLRVPCPICGCLNSVEFEDQDDG